MLDRPLGRELELRAAPATLSRVIRGVDSLLFAESDTGPDEFDRAGALKGDAEELQLLRLLALPYGTQRCHRERDYDVDFMRCFFLGDAPSP